MSYRTQQFSIISEPTYDPADIGPALQAALLRVKNSTVGGTVFIPENRGGYAIVTPVSVDFDYANGPAYVGLESEGSPIRLALSNPAFNAIQLQNMQRTVIRGIVLVGNPVGGAAPDCQNGLILGGTNANIDLADCDFWGVRSNTIDSGALSLAGNGQIRVDNVYMVGCGSYGAPQSACLVITAASVQIIRNLRCVDFDSFQGVSYNKAGGFSWVMISGQVADPFAGNHDVGYTVFEGCFFDENQQHQIYLAPSAGKRLDRVKVVGTYFNIPNVALGDAINATKTRSLVVEDSAFTLQTTSYGGKAIVVSEIDQLLRVVRCAAQEAENSPKQIQIGANVENVQVIECDDPVALHPAHFAIVNVAGFPTNGGGPVQNGRSYEWPSNVGTPIGWWQADSGVLAVAGLISSWSPNFPTADPAMVLVQAVAANQPTYVPVNANFNQRPTIRFVPTKALTSNGVFAAPWTQPSTIYIVARVNTSLGFQVLLDGLAAGAENQIGVSAGTNAARLLAGAVVNGTVDLVALGTFVLCATFNGLTSTIYVNDHIIQDGGPADAGAQVPLGITVGAAYDLSSPLDGDIAEIVRFPIVHGIAARGICMAYFGQKYGTPAGDRGIATQAG